MLNKHQEIKKTHLKMVNMFVHKRIIFILVSVILLITSLNACSFLGISKWTAYKVTLTVNDMRGDHISEAIVESSSNKEKTNNDGMVKLYYEKTGLHVITVNKKGKVTKQIKVNFPLDNNKKITIVLDDKIT